MSHETPGPAPAADSPASSNFIRDIVAQEVAAGKHGGQVVTRFPPEPNGFLHLGHAKSICLNFGLAAEFGGRCHLRMDDTNPTKEEQRYIDAIRQDVRWLGFDWGEHEYHASDYFDQIYEWAEQLVRKGLAYVDDQTADELKAHRGTLTEGGVESPHRNRSVDENLDLLRRMKAGEFKDGERVLRAKIDMTSGNVNLRDPVMYRVLHATHPRTGDKWCIYPMYDWAHGQSDSIEHITHSICTLEFEDHRPLYDWFCRNLGIHHPRQIEFARGNLSHTVMSKRKLLALVNEGHVRGWDDPRMPTIAGARRRGYPAASLRRFWHEVGVSKRNQVLEMSRLEGVVRDDLNKSAQRRMAVLDPLKLIIDNYPAAQVEQMDAVNNPEDESAGKRTVPFTRELFIERDDFMENPPKKFFRLAPGAEVRLRYAYWVRCTSVVKDSSGAITTIHCTYDPATRGGDSPPDGRKVKGTIHWVSAPHAVEAEVRLYDLLFSTPEADAVPEGVDWRSNLNPHSLRVLRGVKLEPALREARAAEPFQFERLGYFTLDPDTSPSLLVFNRTVTLKDTWAKEQSKS